jgi:phospholipid/cholesterol/gamma-HCH transport system permease protein
VNGAVASLGARALDVAGTFGGLTVLGGQTLRVVVERRIPWRAVLHSLDDIGAKSVSIVALTALFTGLVLALQTGIGLKRFGSTQYVGYIVSLAIVRELGPVLTALIVGGRVAGGISAEVGARTVIEQVDAIRAMGSDPIRKLVLPRVLACAIALPMLTVLSDVLGVLGGMMIAKAQFNLPASWFLQTIVLSVLPSDVFSGLTKTIFFGLAIGLIACHEGLLTRGGTVGVGTSATRAVVFTSLSVLVLNFFLTKLLILL